MALACSATLASAAVLWHWVRIARAALAEHLSQQGYRSTARLDPRADTRDATSQRTQVRALQESVTNVLRYARPGSTCHLALVVRVAADLRVSSELSAARRPGDPSSGWGLRTLRERIELSWGAFAAGPRDGRCMVEVSLLADVSRVLATGSFPRPTSTLRGRRFVQP